MIKMVSNPKLKSPIMICAWPGMGEVAIRTALYLKKQLGFRELARMTPADYFELPGVVVHNAVLNSPSPGGGIFYYYKDPARRRDIILCIAGAQPIAGKSIPYATEIIKFAQRFGVQMILSFAALSTPIDHTQTPGVWIAASNRKLLDGFKGLGVKMLKDGQISGMNGLILGVAKRHGIDGACLLGEIPLYAIQIENPKASYAILEVLSKYLLIRFDLASLDERAKIMEDEIHKLIGYLKGEPQESQPLSEDEVERLKLDLADYSKLPESARKKIEELFMQAGLDIGKANDLKKELDTWHVFDEYQDRFLDLFRNKRANQ
ncbi:MAG: PAC2 family protein [Candidatus Omnitrophota bacterium]